MKLETLKFKTSDGETIELTLEQAEALYAELGRLFGSSSVYIPAPPVSPYPGVMPMYAIDPVPDWLGNIVDLEPEFHKIITENYWDLV